MHILCNYTTRVDHVMSIAKCYEQAKLEKIGTTHSGYGTTPVRYRGGNRYVEGDLLTFGYLMLDDALGFPYYRLINVG